MHDESGSNHRCRSAAAVAWATRVAVVTLCLLVHGCDTVSGGAVELSWKLRPASSVLSQKFVGCTSGQDHTGPVTRIRLSWQVGDAPEDSASWPCEANHGATGFQLPEGMARLRITPECAYGEADPGTYISPAALERAVTRGDTVSLGAVEIVVAVTGCRDPTADSDVGVPCICCSAEHPCN